MHSAMLYSANRRCTSNSFSHDDDSVCLSTPWEKTNTKNFPTAKINYILRFTSDSSIPSVSTAKRSETTVDGKTFLFSLLKSDMTFFAFCLSEVISGTSSRCRLRRVLFSSHRACPNKSFLEGEENFSSPPKLSLHPSFDSIYVFSEHSRLCLRSFYTPYPPTKRTSQYIRFYDNVGEGEEGAQQKKIDESRTIEKSIALDSEKKKLSTWE
jgi:hypothetical protein